MNTKMLKLGVDYKGILGAAIGDISGSYIEFKSHLKPKTLEEAELFHPDATFTDDTVMTAAVADCLKNQGKYSFAQSLRYWGRKYHDAGYGSRFVQWLFDENMGPYRSCGNGSAMRVSAVPYYCDEFDQALRKAMDSANPTHNHSEGEKGAYVVSGMIFKCLQGASKLDLLEYARFFYPDFEKLDYEEMKAYLGHGPETCQVTVPQAIWAFFHTDSFEECLRMCHTIGWDCDTLAAIACSIAEAYYKEIPEWIVLEAQKRLPKDIRIALESVPVDLAKYRDSAGKGGE